eukprot:364362-Chlamydomonas_euryale.AAC.31
MASGSSKVYCGQHVPAAFMSANWHWLLAQKPEPLGPVMLEHGNLSWRQTCAREGRQRGRTGQQVYADACVPRKYLPICTLHTH